LFLNKKQLARIHELMYKHQIAKIKRLQEEAEKAKIVEFIGSSTKKKNPFNVNST
jgi:hypothetical protein